MKRLLRFKQKLVPLALAAMWWSAFTGSAVAQQPNAANPLRPASKPVASKPGAKPTATASSEAPVGTALRTSEKRTPVKRTPEREAPREHSILVERSRSSSSAVSPAAYRTRVARPTRSHSTEFASDQEIYTGSTVLNGTVTVQRNPADVIDGGITYEHGSEPMIGDFEGVEGDHAFSGEGCSQCCLLPCPQIPWDNLTIFGGVEGFTGPKNGGQTGSFGFHEGANWGAPLPCFNGCLGMQLGAQVTQANLSGSEFTPETRHQTFVTGGLFRRVDSGLQYGLVFDYLSDDWYTNTDLTQLRAEVAWVFPSAHELGFWMTASMDEDTANATVFDNQIPVTGPASWKGTDLYAFFYRHRFSGWEGATGRLFAGFSGESDGFIGSDVQVPLSCDIALQAGFAYLVPEETKGPASTGNEQESWNVGISLVWYPGCATSSSKSYFAPLFNVADNGSFMVDQVR